MNRKKQNPIAKNLQDIIKEADLHSEKKLKENNFSRFIEPSIQPDTSSKATTKPHSSTNKNERKNINNTKTMKKVASPKRKKTTNSTQNIELSSSKKQRKKIWQKDSLTQQNYFVSVIDKRMDMKKIRGKSLLCVGGVRSGKSDLALAWANMFKGNKAFIATMQTPKDFEAKQNSKEKDTNKGKNNTPQTPSPSHMEANSYTDKNHEQYDDLPYLRSDRIKDMYRIHTLMDNEDAPFSYHPHVSSKFDNHHEEQRREEQNHEEYNHNDEQKQTSSDKLNYSIKNKNPHSSIELEVRISKHQAQRGKYWITIEEPTNLIRAINKAKDDKCSVAIIDCLTLWLTNLILQDKTDKQILHKVEELADLLKKPPIPIAIVTNEVGTGVVPDNALARRFRDLQGKANQILAQDSSSVIVSFCGLPLLLKG